MENRDFWKVRREALRQGWRIQETKKGEMFYSPNCRDTAHWHKTPSDRHALHQFVRDLKRGGFVWPPERKQLR